MGDGPRRERKLRRPEPVARNHLRARRRAVRLLADLPAVRPGLRRRPENTQAGAFSPFTVNIERPDGQQALKTIGVHLPPGSAAMLSSVDALPDRAGATPTRARPESLDRSLDRGRRLRLEHRHDPRQSLPHRLPTRARRSACSRSRRRSRRPKPSPRRLQPRPHPGAARRSPSTKRRAATVTSDPLPAVRQRRARRRSNGSTVISRPARLQVQPDQLQPAGGHRHAHRLRPDGRPGVANVSSPFQATNCARAAVQTDAHASNVESNVSRSTAPG